MPYITEGGRRALNDAIDALAEVISKASPDSKAGEVNYVVTRLLNRIYTKDKYKDFNEIIGVLECIKQEFYRRRVAPYEDKKCKENGDVF